MHRMVVEASPGQEELNIENLVVRVPVRLRFASIRADQFHASLGLH